jgi:hypothetical protein
MSLSNPFAGDDGTVKCPETREKFDDLRDAMHAHITKVTIEAQGLPDVVRALERLEQRRAEVYAKSWGLSSPISRAAERNAN